MQKLSVFCSYQKVTASSNTLVVVYGMLHIKLFIAVTWFSYFRILNIILVFIFRDMLAYGCTRLEIGVQSVYEDVARDTNRFIFNF